MIIDNIIKQLEYEIKEIGYIIDDRSFHHIPFGRYVEEHAKLCRILEACKAEK